MREPDGKVGASGQDSTFVEQSIAFVALQSNKRKDASV